MKKAIFKRFIIVIIITSVISLIVSYIVTNSIFYKNTVMNMVYSAKLLDYNINYENNLQEQIDKINPVTLSSDSRITIMDLNGEVLADTSVDNLTKLDNHKDRIEFKEALTKEYGSSSRYSSTLSKQLIYVAYKSQKGDYIIRLSLVYNVAYEYFKLFVPIILFWLFIIIVISIIVANKFSKTITKPLKEISSELSKIDEYVDDFHFTQYEYDELNQIVVSTAKLANKINKTMSKLKLERNKIDYILNNMKEGFLFLDKNQNVILINNSARQMLECLDTPLEQNITRYTTQAKLLNEIEKSVNDKKQVVFDLQFGDDTIYCIHITSVKKNIFSNSYSGVGILILDVTSDRNHKQMRQEFFSNVSHELKTPITSIQGFAELLQTGMVTDEETTKDFLGKIKKETQNMTNLINDILMISKLESKVDEIVCSNIKLKSVIEEILSTFSSITHLRNIKVYAECDDIEYYCNLQQIQQLFSNLISNAVKYNVDNGEIKIKCYKDENNVIFDIKDSGIGIPKYAQNRIFERFYRVDKGRSKKMGGTGLGLSIVKHIVQFYNGEIALQSDINKGTNIKIYLPIKNKMA